MTSTFRKAANAASTAVGSVWAFTAAAFVVVAWAVTGLCDATATHRQKRRHAQRSGAP